MCVHLAYLVGAGSPGDDWLSAVTPHPRCLLPALHNRFYSSLSLYAHPWFIATNQKPCALGQEPL